MRIIVERAEVWGDMELWIAIDDNTYDGDIQGVGGSREEAIEDLMEQLEDRGELPPTSFPQFRIAARRAKTAQEGRL